MTLNREAILYANNKIAEVKQSRILPEHLEMELFDLAIQFYNDRFDLQEKAERSARKLSEFVEKLKAKSQN